MGEAIPWSKTRTKRDYRKGGGRALKGNILTLSRAGTRKEWQLKGKEKGPFKEVRLGKQRWPFEGLQQGERRQSLRPRIRLTQRKRTESEKIGSWIAADIYESSEG